MNERRDLEIAVKRVVQKTVNVEAFMSGILDLIFQEKLVSYNEGLQAGKATKTVCSRGHLLEGDNVMMVGKYMKCKECNRQYAKAHRAKKKAAENAEQDS